MARTGRPSTYTAELGERICAAIATSSDGLEKICAEHDGFPNAGTVYQWAVSRPEFAEMYVRAREAQGHYQADLALQEATSATDAALGRLAYDARKWHAGRLAPRVWSDSQQVRLANHDGTGDAPVASPLVAELRALLIVPPAPSQALPAPKDGQG
jgi:hypothetical protein